MKRDCVSRTENEGIPSVFGLDMAVEMSFHLGLGVRIIKDRFRADWVPVKPMMKHVRRRSDTRPPLDENTKPHDRGPLKFIPYLE